ncbi:MAG TPA: hypothetical protein VFX59_16570 [Polyangiales bacterium]|nr:hypothetical protein [Polyangiales bacterium]
MRFLTSAILLLASCGDDAPSPEVDAATSVLDAGLPDASNEVARDANVPFVCDVVAPTSCPSPAPKYADVQPIFTKQCGVCHGQDWTGEWPLDSYSHISDWQDEIRSELVTCAMPPVDSGVMIPLASRMKILEWIRCGLPR